MMERYQISGNEKVMCIMVDGNGDNLHVGYIYELVAIDIDMATMDCYYVLKNDEDHSWSPSRFERQMKE